MESSFGTGSTHVLIQRIFQSDDVFVSKPILHFTSYQNTYVIDMEEEGKSLVATLDDDEMMMELRYGV